jgi:Mg2+ and Co2+ transporter CorA
MASISLATMTASAGFFGMNVLSGLEERPIAVFWGIVGGSVALSGLVFMVMRTAYVRVFLLSLSCVLSLLACS